MVAGSALLQAVLSLANTQTNLTELFGPSLSPGAKILLPTQKHWKSHVQRRWSEYQAPEYLGAIKPATEGDIQQIVKIATDNNIPFLTLSGGHGTTDYTSFSGVAIDLGNFKTVEVDAANNRLNVGGATEYSQLSGPLYDAGKELPLASCACVGVIGATMGGGVGVLMGHRGLMLDALESVRMVTANGSIVTASKTKNADLFWAVRGAGHNFGVVASATYKIYDITNDGEVTIADLVFPASANHSFWRALQTYDKGMPSTKLGISALALYDREHEMPILVVHAAYFGPRKEGEAYLEPFTKLGPFITNIVTMPQSEMFPPDHGSCLPDQRINIYTMALKQFDPPTFDEFYPRMVDFWQQHPEYDGRLLIQRFPNDAVVAVPDAETVYPWRDAIANMNIENFYTDSSYDDDVNKFTKSARDQFAKSSGYDQLATYVNYAHGDEGPEAWYSTRKLARLSALKRQWDPKGLFSFSNPVPKNWVPSLVEEL